jgi:hypothetical protein
MPDETTIYCPHLGGMKRVCETPSICAGGADCRLGPDLNTQMNPWPNSVKGGPVIRFACGHEATVAQRDTLEPFRCPFCGGRR